MLALMAGPVMVLAQVATRPVPLPRATASLTAPGETNRPRIFISNPGFGNKTGLFTGNVVKNYQTALGLLVDELRNMAPSPQSSTAESR